MDFFCANCKQRHPVQDIAVPMGSFLQKEIVAGLNAFGGTLPLEFRNNLIAFVNGGSLSLNLTTGRLLEMLKGASKEGTSFNYNYTVSLDDILSEYTKKNPSASLPQEAEREKKKAICSKQLQFEFFRNEEDQLVINAVIDEDGSRYVQRVCGHCGEELSRPVGRAPEIVIALAGTPRAGKTSCLVATVASLDRGMAVPSLKWEMYQDDKAASWTSVRNELEFYRKGYAITKTATAGAELAAQKTKSFLVSWRNKVKRVITFIDMPGEFWTSKAQTGLDDEFHRQYAKLYHEIDCIWLFISKMTAYQLADKGLLADASETEQGVLDGRPAQLEANLRILKENFDHHGRQIPPVAVVLTKAEQRIETFDEGAERGLFPINQNVAQANHNEYQICMQGDALNCDAFFSRAVETRKFFGITQGKFCEAIESTFPSRTYIAVSSYGHPAAPNPEDPWVLKKDEPTARQEITATPPEPYHELFPLLWTLAIKGVIPVKQPCEWRKLNMFRRVKPGSQKRDLTQITADYAKINWPKDQRENTKDMSQDERRIERDAMRNLLMQGNSGRVVVTQFDHPRE